MKERIIYNADNAAKVEIAEMLEGSENSLLYADSMPELIDIMNKIDVSHIYMHVRNLSDISLLHTIRSLNRNIQVSVIVQPKLYNIIQLLKDDSYDFIKEMV